MPELVGGAAGVAGHLSGVAGPLLVHQLPISYALGLITYLAELLRAASGSS